MGGYYWCCKINSFIYLFIYETFTKGLLRPGNKGLKTKGYICKITAIGGQK